MTLTDAKLRDAESRMEARLKKQPHATRAVYDEKKGRIVVGLSNGLEIGFPVELAQGLAGAGAADLSVIEITPTGLGLHWPRLDTDLHLPALMEGFFGSRRWMAQL